MKYFLLSSFASAFLLYGMALTYGSVGSIESRRDPRLHEQPSIRLGSAAMARCSSSRIGLMAVGFSFKVSADTVPGMDAGCLRRRADLGDGLHVGGHEGRGVRRHGARLPRRASAAPAQWQPIFWALPS